MKTSKLRVTGLCVGNSPVTGDPSVTLDSHHKGPIMRKSFPYHGNIIGSSPMVSCRGTQTCCGYIYYGEYRLALMLISIIGPVTDTNMNTSTHGSRVMHGCVGELGHYRFKYWLVSFPAPSHYLNQRKNIVNWFHGNKFQWNSNQNTNIIVQENVFENVVCEMVALLSRSQCVNNTLSLCSTLFYPIKCSVIWHLPMVINTTFMLYILEY